ncbi:hypothetical protein K7X08_007992 [Anisodus acutangulus]|uniref:RING-type E3 ubiquitin transferase n=1 Tax=Anisodus acutangulus TaxID=402998 RepID=A0A9Q1RNX7_9SOLA|nr:hypothetical protein K7X08_007992 [Anisodus acutangulus]
MFGSGMNLITTIIGFGMSATFIVFVCTRLICGRISRRQSRQMFEIESGIDLELPEHRINGLDSVVVAAIPTMKFHSEAFTSLEEDTQCSICLSEYQENEVLRIMPKCGHSFHLSCIDIWLRKQSTCPVCRLSVPESIENKQRRPAALLGRDQNADSSEISVEHSRQWLLPTADRSQGTVRNSDEAVSVSINPEPVVPAEAAASVFTPLNSTVAAMSDDPVREWILSEGKATQIKGISPIGGEALGLNAMYETGSIREPKPYKVGSLPTGGSYIIMEFIEFGASRRNQSALGRRLAEMHTAATSEKGFGFQVDNTIGRAKVSKEPGTFIQKCCDRAMLVARRLMEREHHI